MVFFECDKRKCEHCSFPECKHTSDIRHAKNFKNVVENVFEEEIKENKEMIILKYIMITIIYCALVWVFLYFILGISPEEFQNAPRLGG